MRHPQSVANVPEHLFLGVGLIQKIGPVQRGRVTRDPQIKSGRPIANPDFWMGGLGTPQNKWWLTRFFHLDTPLGMENMCFA
jgi:hypothetical protein